jgi:hypothetical protein
MPLKSFYCLGSKNHRKRGQTPLPNYEQQLVPLESLLPEEIKGSTTVRYFLMRFFEINSFSFLILFIQYNFAKNGWRSEAYSAKRSFASKDLKS